MSDTSVNHRFIIDYFKNIKIMTGSSIRMVNSVIKKLISKGNIYFIDSDGKILGRGSDDTVERSVLKKIKANREKYENSKIVKIEYNIIDKDNMYYKKGDIGRVEVRIGILKVVFMKNNPTLSLAKRGSLTKFYYFDDELKDFKLEDVKRISNMVLNTKEKLGILSNYSFKQIEKTMNNM